MDVTAATWIVAIAGIALMTLLATAQTIALVRPRSPWTIGNIYGGSPDDTDPTAYFAVNHGYALADAVFWAPLQFAASIGMLLGHRWGFALALVASAPFWYSAILLYVWDRDLEIRRNTIGYWILWGIWPAFGIVEGVYCFVRLLD